MKKFIKEKGPILLTILLLCGIMFYYNTRKNGFHEDEMYSYGASNYRYDNVFRPYGYTQSNNDYFFKNILQSPNQISKTIHFLTHQEEYQDKFDPTLKKEVPIWKTKEEAIEYMTISKSDILNFASIWYNQLCDVHPPMFYNILHIFSTLFIGTFTKYIGFIMNLIFFLITILFIHKIMKLENKSFLSIPAMILYGGSMGAISTVSFQRMYMMLTCFSVIYLYYALKFLKQNYQINKKDKILWSTTIFLGFMTQYYFCIYIVLIFGILSTYLLKEKNYSSLKSLFLIHLIPAIIGILVFPSCIEDIFFSYRGLGASKDHTKTFLESFLYYNKGILKSFSIPLIIFILFLILFLLKIRKDKKNGKSFSIKNHLDLIIIFLPIPLFLLIISKIAPFLGEEYTTRYMMLLFPSIAILFTIILHYLNTKKNYLLTIGIILLTIFGLYTQKPTYLYERYNEVENLAIQNQEKHFIYIFDNNFTHLSSMKEFMTYEKSLIINYNNYDFKLLKKDKELSEQKEVILCIKNWLNTEELLNKVLENTNFTAEPILEIKEDINSSYYKLKKP